MHLEPGTEQSDPIDAHSPGLLIRVAQQVHSRIWAEVVSDYLTSPQFGVLRVLGDQPDLDQRAVGEQVLLDKATGGDVIGRVVRREWVRTQQDPLDRRRNLLRLTPAGRRLLTQAVAKAEQANIQLMAPLSGAEQGSLLAILLAIARTGPQEVPDFIAHTPGALIRVVQQVHTRVWSTELAGELTPVQYAVLAVLAREPGIDQRTVAQRVVMDKATGAGVIARLIARRWLRSRQDRGDRRRNLLRLTATGARVLTAARPRSNEVERQLMLPLTARQQAAFGTLMTQVARLES
jgi:DNA-binding MarR family transcriptional regulator